MNYSTIKAITLDLDDTLWPIAPTLLRAEEVLHDWMRLHAPRTARIHDTAAMMALRAQVALDHPQWSHDLSALRRETIRRALQAGGEDPGLAEPAFEAFFEARQQVELYADVLPALRRMSAAYPLLALSNGNADLRRVGLGDWFVGGVSARETGVGKPDVRIFHAACERLGLEPHEVLHVGDDLALDVEGALGAGLHAAWVRRAEGPDVIDDEAALRANSLRVSDLMELAQRLPACA